MDFEQARFNMIEQQIRPWEVLDPAVLGTLEAVRREEFVPARYRELAFADMSIPLDDTEVMMSPKVEARLLQALDIRAGDRTLNIGTGSGYVAALMSALGGDVTSVEIKPELADRARQTLVDQGFDKVKVVEGDGADGWPDGAPWDAVLIGGSVAALDEAWQHQLTPGGRLVCVVGSDPIMEAVLVTRLGEDTVHTVSLFDTILPALTGAGARSAFVF